MKAVRFTLSGFFHSSLVLVLGSVFSCLPLVDASGAELGRTVPTQVAGHLGGGGTGGGPATGLQLALVDPAQIFNSSYSVYGFRLNLLYGKNADLRGFDLGLCNHITGLAEGLQLGAVNVAAELSGAQIGIYNSGGYSEAGCFELGVVNQAGDIRGCQLGVINFARNVNGTQIGLINLSDTMEGGVQVGLINIITQSDGLIFCPIINGQF